MVSRAAVAVVLAASLPLPIQAHDIYSHLTDKLGTSCCDDRDCQLAPYRFVANGLQMFVDKRWIAVPSDKIQYVAVPGDTGETGGGHWCGFADQPNGSACTSHAARSCRLNLRRPSKARYKSQKVPLRTWIRCLFNVCGNFHHRSWQ